MRVLVTGSHGLIGTALVARLRSEGHHVVRLVRSPGDPADVLWDPAAGTIAADALEGVDGVVHLAGEGIAERRWTDAQKARIRDSRINGTRVLAETLAGLRDRPSVLVSGSAIGWYGDRGDEILTEDSSPGNDFLARLCLEWEAATRPAVDAGIRVVMTRTGIVQSRRGGALGQQLRLFRLGLGGRLGAGRQYMSWVSIDDHVGATIFALEQESLSGPVNVTAPHPVTNREYTAALGRSVRRPAVLVVPKAALAVRFGGELVDSLLASQRVMPARLTEAGYRFQHETIDEGLRAALQA